jgi:hypothetical protein
MLSHLALRFKECCDRLIVILRMAIALRLEKLNSDRLLESRFMNLRSPLLKIFRESDRELILLL